MLYEELKTAEVCGMKQLIILCWLVFSALSSMAQYDDPGLPGGDPDVPIDGGVGLLLVAGVCYGIKKIREVKQ